MKRFLSLFLVAAVLISCLTITTFADDGSSDLISPSSFDDSFIDLLTAPTYTYYQDGVFDSTRNKPSRTFPNKPVSSNKIAWTPLSAVRIRGYNFCLWSGTKPDEVIVEPFPGGKHYPTYVGSVGAFRYYTYETSTPFDYSYFSVTAKYNTSSTVNFGLFSFFGYVDDSFSVSSVKMTHEVTYYDDEWKVLTNVNNRSYSLPAEINYAYQIDHNSTYKIDVTLPISNASSLSFKFSSIGSAFYNSGISVSVMKNGTYKYSLPVQILEGMGDDEILVNGTALLYNYTCNVDLSGVDLSGCTIRLTLDLDAWEDYPVYVTDFFLLGIAYKQETYTIPWYLRFYNWLTNKMDSTTQTIVDAITGNGSAVDDAGNAMQGAADDLNNSADAFDQVETPDIDASTITGDFTNFNASGLAVLAVMTNNPYVTSLLVLVFTFALCAYIFFGKRR